MTKIKIEPAYKKSTVEIEFFKNDDNVWIHVVVLILVQVLVVMVLCSMIVVIRL